MLTWAQIWLVLQSACPTRCCINRVSAPPPSIRMAKAWRVASKRACDDDDPSRCKDGLAHGATPMAVHREGKCGRFGSSCHSCSPPCPRCDASYGPFHASCRRCDASCCRFHASCGRCGPSCCRCDASCHRFHASYTPCEASCGHFHASCGRCGPSCRRCKASCGRWWESDRCPSAASAAAKPSQRSTNGPIPVRVVPCHAMNGAPDNGHAPPYRAPRPGV